MNVVFIGQIYSKEQCDFFTSLGSSVDNAANTFQQALLNGIKDQCDELTVVSTPYVSCYPITKLIVVKGEKKVEGTTHIHSIPFINILGLKHLTKIYSIHKCLKKLVSQSEKSLYVIIYGMHSPFLLSLLGLNRHKRHKVCLIVPDLPEFMSAKDGLMYRIVKKIDRKLINWGLKQVDSYILFSPLMTERLDIDKPFDIIEGIYQQDTQISAPIKETNKTILYSGSLDARYGIIMLLDAFISIKDDTYRLWICGSGDSITKIKEYAAVDNRIKYWGLLPRKEVLILQKKATILINPRMSLETYTRYSFPSKTMEYLASGTPTIMAHLASIPREYDQYIFYVEEETVDGLRKKILEVGDMPMKELEQFGAKAAEFIITKKNNYYQASKLVTLLKALK